MWLVSRCCVDNPAMAETHPSPGPETPDPPQLDPAAMLRSRGFVGVLVLAAGVGLVVSFLSWAFLELVHQIQVGVFTELPEALGYSTIPAWYYLGVLGLAGLPVALAIARLPGRGGHVPAEGLQMGGNEPAMLPGVVLAAVATLGLGLVLGPESPLIAAGAGLGAYMVTLAKRDSPSQLQLVMAAAGSFAAISVVFGSPIVAAIVILEASGLASATMPLVLIPGLVAAGFGSLVFVGVADWTGLPTGSYSLLPLQLAPLSGITLGMIGWTIALGLAGAGLTLVVRRIGLAGAAQVPRAPFLLVPLAGMLVAGLAIAFEQATTESAQAVLFSGQDTLSDLVDGASTWSVGTLAFLVVCKGLAWGLSLAAFRGGPTFPAIFIGAAGGIAASHLPGLPLSAAIAVGIGVMIVSFLKLPLTAILLATLLTSSAGVSIGPLIILGVVVAYLATLALEGRLEFTPASA
jgi:H+/Cl- antiporter ClcA